MALGLAFKAFFSILFSGTLPDNLLSALRLRRELPEKREETITLEQHKRLLHEAQEKAESEGKLRAVQVLAIFQRDARLIDFLCEDIRPYSDAQVGAAVRTLHEGCRKVLDRYLHLEPVISSPEGSTVTVEADSDPSSIKLIGNVIGKPPIKGTLRHKGWRATKVELPALPESGDRSVVAAAEVEVS